MWIGNHILFELLNKDFFVSSLQNCNGAMVDKKSLFSFPRSLKAIRRGQKGSSAVWCSERWNKAVVVVAKIDPKFCQSIAAEVASLISLA